MNRQFNCSKKFVLRKFCSFLCGGNLFDHNWFYAFFGPLFHLSGKFAKSLLVVGTIIF